jgi:hypothetical protein
MQIKKRELRFLTLGQIILDDKYAIYDRTLDSSMSKSLEDSGLLQAFTAVPKESKYLLLDGSRRIDHLMATQSPDYLIPVWVIEDELTDKEIIRLVLSLNTTRKKKYVELLNEYHAYDKVIPNNQGKSGVEKYRHELIAEYMGISVSSINKLRFIDSIKPELIIAVDEGIITLGQAHVKAKQIKYERQKNQNPEEQIADSEFDLPALSDGEEDEANKVRQRKDKIVDLTSLPTLCPCCNRPFSDMTWDDINTVFNKKQTEEDTATDWLN